MQRKPHLIFVVNIFKCILKYLLHSSMQMNMPSEDRRNRALISVIFHRFTHWHCTYEPSSYPPLPVILGRGLKALLLYIARHTPTVKNPASRVNLSICRTQWSHRDKEIQLEAFYSLEAFLQMSGLIFDMQFQSRKIYS